MKVRDLKKVLDNVDDELEVYVYADHGQTTMQAYAAGEMYVVEAGYIAEKIDPEELDYFPDAVKVFEIAN